MNGSVKVLVCVDQIPSTCPIVSSHNTCEKLLTIEGFEDGCEKTWASIPPFYGDGGCRTSTPGYVKDNCKITCGTCNGK